MTNKYSEQRQELDTVKGTYSPYHEPLDAEIVKRVPCPDCGSHNCHYEGYMRGIRYRAFAICDDCGYIEEM